MAHCNLCKLLQSYWLKPNFQWNNHKINYWTEDLDRELKFSFENKSPVDFMFWMINKTPLITSFRLSFSQAVHVCVCEFKRIPSSYIYKLEDRREPKLHFIISKHFKCMSRFHRLCRNWYVLQSDKYTVNRIEKKTTLLTLLLFAISSDLWWYLIFFSLLAFWVN